MSLNLIELHLIIQSMTRSQKRSFTMHVNRNKSNSNALVLFQALNLLEKYDKEHLIFYLQKNNKHKLIQNLTSETANLYNLVLKKFMSLTNRESIDDKMENTFREVIFLQERGLFAKAQRMLKKLKKDAIKHKQNKLLLEISEFERRIKRNANKHKNLDSILEIKKKELEFVEALELDVKFVKLEVELRDIYDRIFYLSQNVSGIERNIVRAKLTEIETALNNIDETQCNCFNSKILYLNSKVELYHLKSDKDAVFKCVKKMQQIYESQKNSSKNLDFKFINFLANYLNNIVRYNEPKDQFLAVLRQLKNFETNSPFDEVIQFSNIYYSEFLYYLKQGDFEKMGKLIPALLEGLEKYKNAIELGRQIVIWYNLSIYYFIKEDFDSTHLWIQKILNNGKKSRRIDFYYNGKVFELLIHYELNEIAKVEDTDFLESLTEKVRKSFYTAKKSNGLVSLVVKLIKTYCKKMRLEKTDFEVALQQFNKIDKSKNKYLPYDEVGIWLKSKTEGLPMLKIAEQILHN